MTTLRTAAQQALEALEGKRFTSCGWRTECDKAITALRAALAEPVQEPVANRAFLERILTAMEGVIDVADRKTDEFDALRACVIDLTLMLHTAPPQRKPLGGEQLRQIELGLRIYYDNGKYDLSLHDFARAIERAHGIGEQP